MRSRLDTHDLGDRCTINACRDRKDDNFLEIVVNRKSDYLITADCDLLGFHPFHNIPILAPIEFIFLLMLRGSSQDPHP
jgi:predicted nucleic acid-binding protein